MPEPDPVFHSPWEDPNVKAALKSREPSEIMLMQCGKCGCFSYYNEGSHWGCQWCEHSLDSEQIDRVIDNGDVVSLDDYADIQAYEEYLP